MIRLHVMKEEGMAWDVIIRVAWEGVLELFGRFCTRGWREVEVGMHHCARATQSFLKMVSQYADEHGGMKLEYGDTPPYTYVGIRIASPPQLIRVSVPPSESKRAARNHISGLCAMEVLTRLHIAWKDKFWYCHQHEPGSGAGDWCPYCLRYKGDY